MSRARAVPATAGGAVLLAAGLRVVHVIAVFTAAALLYGPSATIYFRRR